jgi:hypothetical protein
MQQIASIHEQVSLFFLTQYPGYEVLSVRDNIRTDYLPSRHTHGSYLVEARLAGMARRAYCTLDITADGLKVQKPPLEL